MLLLLLCKNVHFLKLKHLKKCKVLNNNNNNYYYKRKGQLLEDKKTKFLC